ncbi:1-acyl-sn-glycerol-3-phosphate acyltransferase [Sphingosinicella sp. BN140058]|uniref:lysophospholipid acyltransferase family protein n=1 Tax=Sphingosinicella sp. BN140058 TaxID=1892855 RepID=UPI00101134EF|nr:lysophospholipid acyltransferase family protein [Sphingosinicella sp. BN140058]QAY76910.1 1-acyl-sn-glycerol-3-phosphate acyltransferase [Sphingosinicella sp. BN140058]
MALLRSVLFAAIFYLVTVLMILVALPATLIWRRRGARAAAHIWTRFHRWCAVHLLGIRTRIEGHFPPGPALVAAKHQAMYETMELVVILDTPAIVMKRELSDLPLWGRLARAYGLIPVDREGGAAALRRMLRAAEEAVEAGRPIVIFPEGTRVAPGDAPPLQPGFAGLYRALRLPVVPIALDSGRLLPRGRFVKHPGTVTIRVGETIPAGLPRKEAEAAVHAAINALG